jgi:hypothetical protein
MRAYAIMTYLLEMSRQPGDGSVNSSTPKRRSAASIASNVDGTLVGGALPWRSQYLAARELKPASAESCDCVSPASTRAARNCRLDLMLDVIVVIGLLTLAHLSTGLTVSRKAFAGQNCRGRIFKILTFPAFVPASGRFLIRMFIDITQFPPAYMAGALA